MPVRVSCSFSEGKSFGFADKVNIPLRKGYLDPLLLERRVDLPIQFVNQPAFVLGPVGPAEQLIIQC
jgi:hypothetical protein